MKKTFEHLLGLNAKDALAILSSCGIFDVRVTYTHAPKRADELAGRRNTAGLQDEPKDTTMLDAVAKNFAVSERESAPDPLLEPELDDGMLTEARVVGVRDDGRRLIVSRFHVSPAGRTKTGAE